MTPIWNAIGRAVVAFAWGPVDRTVCRFANLTDTREEKRAAARYFTAIGHNLPLAERSEWLRNITHQGRGES